MRGRGACPVPKLFTPSAWECPIGSELTHSQKNKRKPHVQNALQNFPPRYPLSRILLNREFPKPRAQKRDNSVTMGFGGYRGIVGKELDCGWVIFKRRPWQGSLIKVGYNYSRGFFWEDFAC